MKVNVPSSSSSLFVVFLLALLASAATHTEVQADRIDPLLPFCKTISSGSHDDRSRDAGGYSALSIIAIDLLAANATSTGAKIGGLLKKAGGGKYDATTMYLQSCQSVYTSIVGLMPGCAAAIKGGEFDRAALILERAAGAVKGCEELFRDHNLTSPSTVEDDSAFKLAKLAVALIGAAS
ncbi:uncharacterized protein LOC120686531 [Panicum virgatum]|uniref:Pectinesterase inhibitor domain-containing protein n=1 Tax=Panicum virgatum TaxID=38727 RepID=A0A8T0P4H2_PANVG|nr:uncharacterized protein LOC120686531 [Panicum virgatum]KAG2555645.1 hypothetical protein PVAP13_8NG037800 [Panicum virgatum]